MQVWNLLHAARWKCRTQKKSPKIAIWAPSHNFVTLCLRNEGTYRQSEKSLLSSDMSSTCPHNMVNFGLLTAEIDPVVWGTLQILTGFAFWQHYCTASSSGRQPNFAALNRGRHLCLAGRPSRWALAHILVRNFLLVVPWMMFAVDVLSILVVAAVDRMWRCHYRFHRKSMHCMSFLN